MTLGRRGPEKLQCASACGINVHSGTERMGAEAVSGGGKPNTLKAAAGLDAHRNAVALHHQQAQHRGWRRKLIHVGKENAVEPPPRQPSQDVRSKQQSGCGSLPWLPAHAVGCEAIAIPTAVAR